MKMRVGKWVLPITALVLVGCGVEGSQLGSTGVDLEAFEAFRDGAPRSVEDGVYIVEGDLRIGDEAKLYEYWLRGQSESALSVRQVVTSTWPLTIGDNVWNSTQKLNLTYCVNSNFGVDQARVTAFVDRAAREWERRANVNFVHVPAQDGSGCTGSNGSVVFNVTKITPGGDGQCRHSNGDAYGMSSFKPFNPRSERQLEVCGNMLGDTEANLVGIFGHELGHSLGAPHEHLRPDASPPAVTGCDGTWDGRTLTALDVNSIMFYPGCRPAGSSDRYWWSPSDRIGMASLYGAGYQGKSDILWRNASGAVAVWLMNGATAGMGGPISVGAGWEIQGTGDFDGDRKNDILWRGADGTLAIWFMNGAVQAGAAYPGTQALWWQILGVGDFNGDGKSDILWRDTGGQLAIWFMNGGVQTAAVYPGVLGTRALEGIGDFNRDGISDLLWGPSTSNPALGDRVVWLIGNGSVLTTVALGGASAGWSVKGTGDFNGDGTADILWRHTDGTNAIWPLQDISGSSVARLPDLYPPAVTNDWLIQGTGDFNGDWKSDILWRNTDGTTAIWFMDGATRLSAGYPGIVDNGWVIRGTGYFD